MNIMKATKLAKKRKMGMVRKKSFLTTVNASEYRKEFKKPRQIISFSNTLRYASNVQSLILKLNPWLFKTVGSIKDASTT